MSDLSEVLTLTFVGDIHPDRDRPKTLFDLVVQELRLADITFAPLECTISDKGVVRTDVRNPAHRVPPRNIDALKFAGFDIVSFAGNNNLDYGIEAFLDTIDRLKSHEIAVVGAGNNLDEARSPVILERNGVKVAFISHCSILRDGYEATPERPGIAPLKVKTFYEPLENIYEQPGTPAKTVTIPDHDDLTAVLKTIKEAKSLADIVVASFHWGVHFTHDLAIYQPEVGYAAIDAGADLVIGSHPHCLQAIDVYKGKVIFYSLGNFAFETTNPVAKRGVAEYLSFYGLPLGEEAETYRHPTHTRQSVIVKCRIEERKICQVSLIPSLFGDKGKPELCPPGSQEFEDIFKLLKDLSGELGTILELHGDEIVVAPTKEREVDTRDLISKRKVSYPSLRKLPFKERS